VISGRTPRPQRARQDKLIAMYRTRVAAIAMLVPVVIAAVAAVIIAARSDTGEEVGTGLAASPPAMAFLAEGGNRGW
jgi:hypothetical protein